MGLSLAALLAGAERTEHGLAIEEPAGWMQGRTAYGGLSAALAHEAARRLSPDLPPLGSAQVSFVGPLAGRIEARAEPLRRGRSTAFVQVDVTGEAGLGLRAMLVFTAARESALAFSHAPAPDAPAPEEAAPANRVPPANFFTGNFEFRHALPPSDEKTPHFLRWVRLAERAGLDPTTELLACADALPPAAMAMMTAPGPVSSVTWLVNLLQPRPRTRDGWWLLQARAEHARDGASSQSMAVWSADGAPAAAGLQSVAVFV